MTTTVDPKKLQIESLEKSIEHWKLLYSYVKGNEIRAAIKEGWRADSCKCCIVYNTLDEHFRFDCKGCPIKEHIGYPNCLATPWAKVDESLNSWVSNPNIPGNQTYALDNVMDEINFLNHVLEKLND